MGRRTKEMSTGLRSWARNERLELLFGQLGARKSIKEEKVSPRIGATTTTTSIPCRIVRTPPCIPRSPTRSTAPCCWTTTCERRRVSRSRCPTSTIVGGFRALPPIPRSPLPSFSSVSRSPPWPSPSPSRLPLNLIVTAAAIAVWRRPAPPSTPYRPVRRN